MGTHIFSGGHGAVTQVANGWTFQPATPVELKTKGKPGVAWHDNNSRAIQIPLGTIHEHGTQMANRYGAMDQGRHDPVPVKVGWFTKVRDKFNQYSSYVKSVAHEAGEMVVDGVSTLANAVLVRLSPQTAKMIDNAGKVLGGLQAHHFGDAAKAEVDQVLEALKDPSTYAGLGVSIAATAVQGVPVLGQAVGGAVMVDRAIGTGQAAVQAAEEIRAITDTWTSEMTPAQLEDARARLARWLIGSGAALLFALAGRKFLRSTKSNGKNDTRTTRQGSDTKDAHGKGQCDLCPTPQPVLLASGQKFMDETDFFLPGPGPLLSLAWRRRYRSGLVEDGPFGRGWSHAVTQQLRLSAEGMVLQEETGHHVALPLLAEGAEYFDPYEKFTVRRPGADLWIVEHKSGLQHHFLRQAAEQWRLPLTRLQDRDGNAIALHWEPMERDAVGGTAEPLTWSGRQERERRAREQGSAGHPISPSSDPFAAAFGSLRLTGLTDTAGRHLRLAWQCFPTPADHDALCGERIVRVELLVPGHAPTVLVRYDYDPRGQLVATHHGEAPYRQYAWRSGVLVGYRKASGHRYFAQYDNEGPEGRVLRSWCADTPVPGQDDDRFAYFPTERITRHTDGLGRVTAYHWDARFNIVATVTAEGTTEAVRKETPFDATGAPRGRIDALGRRTSLRHDARGNIIQITDALGQSTQLQYSIHDQVTRLRDALGQEWLREYDAGGHLVRAIDPLGDVTQYVHDSLGRPVKIIDARGGTRHLTWDEAGNLVAATDCSGRTTRFAYGAMGQILERTDAIGQATRYGYDAAGRLVRVEEPSTHGASVVHQYVWNGEGQLLAYTDPLGRTTSYIYDGAGRPLTRQDAAGRILAYHYDRAGRLMCLVNENRAQTTFRYDLRDQLTDEIGFDGRWQRYVYNAAGELTHVIEAVGCEAGPGKVTRFERDALGRPLAKRSHGHDGVEESTYRYDALGRLTEANNAAAHLAFSYDPVGQLLSETQTLVGQGRFIHPRPGLNASSDLVRTLTHAYDPLGNRIRTGLPDGRTLNWLFYGSGHLHQINIADPEANAAHEVITDIERDALHREIERSQGATTSHYDWDPAGRLVRHRAIQRGSGNVAGASPVLDRAYAYNVTGQLIARADTLRGRQDFRYDPTGRILASLPGEGSALTRELFAFDPAGNLLDGAESQIERHHAQEGRSEGTGLGLVGDNRIRFYQDRHFEYDVHGNVTKRVRGNRKAGQHEILELRWNANRQLTESTTTRHGVTQTTRYTYDALGRRVAKSDRFGTTHYLWDGDLMVHSQRGGRAALFIYEPDSFVPLATIQGTGEDSSTYWYQCDQIGAPLELTDVQGQIAWAADYKVWGEAALRAVPRPATGTNGTQAIRRRGHGPGENWQAANTGATQGHLSPIIEQPFRLQGQQFDEETGLHYNRFRYYDPSIGRFVSQDPIGFEGGINFYHYTVNPFQFTDAYGLAPKKQPSTRALPDGHGATPQEIKDSKIGGGSRKGQQECRDKLLAAAGGTFRCWRCGHTSTNPADMHLGHKNVPTSKGGNLADVNTALEGASCNLSAGNSGYVKDGMSCVERGSCGAPYGR
ncbi:sugar-binding protein [Paracidovorax avenae]|uniref:RHS repeat-associated core domain-containing protein n=1 Tax=Paracidovorax avenae TaxID=80867 RepID=UPI000D21F5D7|nr:RHS repeat-associated core domain-containing protein [Paracidovorax avenae]AVS66200.1 sugar-binding protein [Paracidovorax avenae]